MDLRRPLFLAALTPLVWAQPVSLQSNTSKASDNLPRPYITIRDWAQLPDESRTRAATWPAAVTAIEPAPDGTVYVVYRCFENSCDGRPEAPILKYDKSGTLLKSWGAG